MPLDPLLGFLPAALGFVGAMIFSPGVFSRFILYHPPHFDSRPSLVGPGYHVPLSIVVWRGLNRLIFSVVRRAHFRSIANM